MKVKPSVEQALAIQIIDKNILVCASAGAGKTTVLIERLMKRIEVDKVSVSEILAMTFTETAAAEMKRRLAKKLNEKYAETLAPFLYDQIALLASAQISTIHSFCLSVIRNYSYVLNLDPKRASNILDEATSSLYKKEALNNVLLRAYADQPADFRDLLEHFSSRPEEDKGVRKAILDLSVVLGAKPDPEIWLDEVLSAYNVKRSLSELNEPVRSFFFLHWQLKIEELAVYINDLNLASSCEDTLSDEYVLQLKVLETQTTNAKDGVVSLNYSKIRKALFTMAENIPSAKGSDAMKSARKKIATVLQGLIPECFEEELFLSDMSVMRGRLICLGDLTKAYRTEFESIKQAKKCIDFDDMEHFALKILRDTKFNVRENYQKQFKEILVDEFQDSNDVQNMIVELISRGNNIFRVGDIKQSIYRFRNAKPQIMQGIIDRKEKEDLVIYLKQNFRSDEFIVDFNNLIFNEAMNIPGLRSRYLAEDAVTIGSPRQSKGSPVEIHWVLKEDESLEDETQEEGEEDNEETVPDIEIDEKPGESLKKARHIAADILKRRTDSDKKHWRDYVILVRSHQLKNYLKKAFDEVGIPYFIDVQSGFYQADSVQDVLQLLHLCFQPDNDQLLVGTLLSPFFGFSQEDIAQIYLNKDGSKLRATFAKLYPVLDIQLRELETLAMTMPMHQLLPLIFDINNYYEVVCTHPQRTNLDLFLQKAVNFEENQGSLPRFLTLIEEIKDEKSSEAIPISSEEDVVRVMTIHQSKGLQFPIVYFWSSLRQNILDLRSELICDPDLGIALKTNILPQRYIRNNPIRIAIETKAIQEEMEEQMRVLYVALTRPQNILVIVDAKPKTPFTNALTRSSVFGRIGYSGWLASVMYGKQSHLFVETDVSGEISKQKVVTETTPVVSFIPLIHSEAKVDYLTPSSQEHVFAPDFTLRYHETLEGKVRGTRLHRLIEQLPVDHWSDEIIRNIDSTSSTDEVDSLMTFYHSDFYTSARSAKIEKEFSFALLDKNTVINGIIDMLIIYPDRVELMDFKADRYATREQLVERYQGQIDAYHFALSKIYPDKRVYTFLYSLTLRQVIEVKHDENTKYRL